MSRPIHPMFQHNRLASALTVREYFMAHAPETPQAWFKPQMPPKPAEIPKPNEANTAARPEALKWVSGQTQPQTGAGLAWVAEYEAALKVWADWEAEHAAQTFIQWPAAWADAVMASATTK